MQSLRENLISFCNEIVSFITDQPIQKHFSNFFLSFISNLQLELIQTASIKSLDATPLDSIFKEMYVLLSKSKKKLEELRNNNFYEEIGLNKKFNVIFKEIKLIKDNLFNLIEKTSLSTKIQISDYRKNEELIEGQLRFIDDLAEKIIAKDPNYKKKITFSRSKPGEVSIIFFNLYSEEELTISWVFFANFLKDFIFRLDQIAISDQTLVKIRDIIDELGENIISFSSINHFFTIIWPNLPKRTRILNFDSDKTVKVVQKPSDSIFLILKVIKTSNLDNFKLDQEIIITSKGLINNKRNDNTVYFGRVTVLESILNDICFGKDNKSVSRRQFQITYKENDRCFVLICISKVNPTFIMIRENKQILELDNVILLGNNTYFRISGLFHKKANDSKTIEYFQKNNGFNHKNKEKETIEHVIYNSKIENNIDILYELMNLSVLELEPPNNNKNIDVNRTIPSKKLLGNLDNQIIENKNSKNLSFLELQPLQGDQKKKIFFEVDKIYEKAVFSIGRKKENTFEIQDQEISGFHCQIEYDPNIGWLLGEKIIKEQVNYSQNGTFVFCKTFREYTQKIPSKAIRLYDGIVISSGDIAFLVNLKL